MSLNHCFTCDQGYFSYSNLIRHFRSIKHKRSSKDAWHAQFDGKETPEQLMEQAETIRDGLREDGINV